mmetsp:Transcript_9654/g.10692  ORF Transcript_9654/g.10692 Transcript_9654/m.10692 type:complete len:146 (+) Transcript_9654:25-462(+)
MDKEPTTWGTDDVASWLKWGGFSDFEDQFKYTTGSLLKEYTLKDILSLGVSNAAAVPIYKLKSALFDESPGAGESPKLDEFEEQVIKSLMRLQEQVDALKESLVDDLFARIRVAPKQSNSRQKKASTSSSKVKPSSKASIAHSAF